MKPLAVGCLMVVAAAAGFVAVNPEVLPASSGLNMVQAEGLDRPAAQPAPFSTEPVQPAQAQPAPLPPVQAQPAPPPQNDAPEVDETALRYFAQRGDTRRLEAEIARLRALYPDWTPPADPLAVPAHGDPQLDAMWRLYSEGKLAEVRKAIGDRQASGPSWQPPQDLLDRLATAEARERLVNASDLRQQETVLRVATDFPSLLTCADVDVLWRVAEAFASTGKPDRARDAYLYVLRNCDDPAERQATIQKATPLLPRETLDELFAAERTGTDGTGEFADTRLDVARHSVGAAGKDPQARVRPGDVEMLEAATRRDPKASDDLILGWYYLQRDDARTAADWFAKANAAEPSAEAAQGRGLALIRLNEPAQAEDLLYRWRDENDEIRAAYLAAATNMLAAEPRLDLGAEVLQRIVPVIVANKAVPAAQQLGWYARAYDQHETAGKWFAQALGWDPDDEASAYGLALTRLQLGDRAGVAELQRLWAGRSARIAALGEPGTQRPPAAATPAPATRPVERRRGSAPAAVAGSGNAASRGEDAGGFVDNLPERRNCRTTRPATMNPRAALARGWCLMDAKRPIEAVEAFEAALASDSPSIRREAAWGQSLAYLNSDLTDQAAVAAAKAPQTDRRKVELEAAILSQRAASFFEQKRYNETLLALDQRARIAAERRDMMILRGYSYLHLRRFDDALQVFEALAATGDREGVRGIAAVKSTRRW